MLLGLIKTNNVEFNLINLNNLLSIKWSLFKYLYDLGPIVPRFDKFYLLGK